MKKFLLGALTATLVFSLSISALAITGRITIDVDPINIQVNGETFVPKDVTGKEVPVFAYEGTTYAPLRALAEAYGLEVGYDAAANMATVNDPDAPATPNADTKTTFGEDEEAAYQAFKAMWSAEPWEYDRFKVECIDRDGVLAVITDLSDAKFNQMWARLTMDLAKECNKDDGYYYYQGTLVGYGIYTGVDVTIGGITLPADPNMTTRTGVIQGLSQ